MYRMKTLCPLALLPLLTLAAEGQTATPNWDSVRAIARNTEVRITYDTAKPIRGSLESTTDLSLTLGPGAQSFARPQIISVSVKKKGRRVRNTFIGLGVGLAAGFGIGAAAAGGAGCRGGFCGLAIGAIGGIGMLSGTVVGVAWPTGGWREVYRR